MARTLLIETCCLGLVSTADFPAFPCGSLCMPSFPRVAPGVLVSFVESLAFLFPSIRELSSKPSSPSLPLSLSTLPGVVAEALSDLNFNGLARIIILPAGSTSSALLLVPSLLSSAKYSLKDPLHNLFFCFPHPIKSTSYKREFVGNWGYAEAP